ncbi:phosphatase PAP2 family protein [Agrococcus sp. SGAir0287]|uniref:phosphatase PAP2 family protein n=1 Tax=Agrococcus sp. SGAir0287 TaxID=2070347 RepID=UPI0010CD2BA6|nr:phosphatase PAP2 family protein [Agrococcus sp. SGAir0287]QCR20175.1 phosphatase PAP2 family protein [Agrococcus sp. SGAir0287]
MRRIRPARLALGGLACLVGLVALTAAVGAGATSQADEAVQAWVATARTGWMVSIASALDLVGARTGAAVVGVVAVLLLVAGRRWWAAIAVATSAVAGFALSEAMKPWLGRARPDGGLLEAHSSAFPSGHAAEAAALALAVAIAAGSRGWLVLAAAWMVAMAASRLVLGVHWLSDVVGGLLLGAATALLVWAAVAALQGAGRRRRPS